MGNLCSESRAPAHLGSDCDVHVNPFAHTAYTNRHFYANSYTYCYTDAHVHPNPTRC